MEPKAWDGKGGHEHWPPFPHGSPTPPAWGGIGVLGHLPWAVSVQRAAAARAPTPSSPPPAPEWASSPYAARDGWAAFTFLRCHAFPWASITIKHSHSVVWESQNREISKRRKVLHNTPLICGALVLSADCSYMCRHTWTPWHTLSHMSPHTVPPFLKHSLLHIGELVRAKHWGDRVPLLY